MNLQNKELIHNAILKSDKAMKGAELNFNESLFVNTQNRIYYAIFYIVLALGYLEGFSTSKHSELLGWFNKNFIFNQKVFEPSVFKIYKRIFENRSKFDYDVLLVPQKEDIEKDLEDAKFFVSSLKAYITNSLNK